ncbi:carboxypeptidase-like regulatory domain-containing protein, partial [Candidatus Micrarchaeota archaeon]|nr:carboxypeptidase-like regulatory domain-containing protein [Candidatus Micrarchaeota archaeon]MBU1930479.1 carboxypeptidase-like regulatory domain-containing protein [Candidatus Micrarchaeota archaeon]
MGLLDAIKELYYNGEDRYYHFLDSLDAKGIPVYRIVEPIDKVFPSFALFLIIISILIIALVWFLVTIFFITTVPLSVLVVDSQQNPLPNITVLVEFGDQTVTGTTGVDGKTAPFGIPQNSRAKIVIDRDGFEHFESESFLVETEQTKTVVLLPEGVGPGPGLGEGIPRTIRIVNQQGSPIIGENIHLVFSCINTNITPPQSVTVTSGSVQVIEPPGCNGLIARVTSDSYLTIDSQPIFNDPQSIFLTATQINVDKGNLQVTVLENGVPVTDSIVVVLYDAAGAFSLTQAATVEGVVLFQDLDPGTYKVQTVATDIFGSVSQSNVAVISNQTMSINLSVTASTVGAIKIKVVAEGTNKVIENASVVLLYEDIEIGRQLTSQDSNGFVTFYVSEDVEYDVTVDAKNYCLETRSDIRLSPGSYIVELEPYTASCGGPLLVQVVDQAGKAVSNASVTLANEEHFFLGTAHHLSDLNGMARFTGMPSGTYSAFAYKGTVSGWSDAIFFNKKAGATESIDLTVTMQIPNGILRINVVDKEGQPIPFAQVFFIDTSNNETFGGGARPTDGQGILEFETRADKKVFLIVQKQGFASFVSPEYNILPSTIQEVTIELLPPITKFEIELLGLYQGNLFAPVSSNRSVSLTNGQEYLAKFRVKIPEENSSGSNKANEAGIHLRTGDDTIIEKDLLFLKQTNIPQASIIRSTSFTEDISVDSAAITEGDAKWVNAVWENPLGSVIEADVIIKIKPTAALGEKLSVWYRSWMRVGSSNTKDPVDQSGSDHELYSDAKLARYTVGIGTLCDDTFCFETSIFDPETELNHFLENNFFHAQTKHNYTLTFSIANISERDIDSFRNAELRVKNPEESLLLREYTIFDADPQGSTPIIGVADDYKMPNIDVGDLSPGRQVTGNIAFFTEKLKSGRIVLEIVDTDRKEIVFSREVQILVAADKQLAIRVEPDLLVAGIENDVIFTVTDKDTEEPIENAVVNIRDRFETLLKSSITNSLGKVEMTLPGQAPGEKLFGIAEKPDYNSARVELSVDTDIAEVAPPTIGFGLNSQTQPSDTRIITITNLADFPLIVHAIKINGKFYGLIDEEAMENAIAAFEGTT